MKGNNYIGNTETCDNDFAKFVSLAVKIIIDIIIMVEKRYYDDQTFLWPSYPFLSIIV